MNTLINKAEMPTLSGTIACVCLQVSVQAVMWRSISWNFGTTLLGEL